jgi:hypothetical protein
MSSENTKIWDILGRTDPKHTQQFKRGGGFKGTAIRPIWSFRRMTEQFGPCGIGWGVGEPSFQVVPGDNREVLVYCTASVWFKEGDERSQTVYGVGGDKVVSYIRANEQYNRPERWESDDEAFKKAFTDAITNALKLIGVGADVHMGMFDDSKYVASMRDEFSEAPEKPKRQVGYREDGTRTPHSLRKERVWDEFERELLECQTVSMLTKLALAWSKKAEEDKWPESWRELVREELHKRKQVILNSHTDEDTFPGDRPSNSYVNPLMAG